MKTINATKIFLIILITVTWMMVLFGATNIAVQKDGYVNFTDRLHSSVETLAIPVSTMSEENADERYQDIKKKFGEHEFVNKICKSKELIDMSWTELEEETGREVVLMGEPFNEICYEMLDGDVPEKLQLYEVLIPKYFTPCCFGRYGKESYMDGEKLVGRSFSMSGYSVTFQVVGTYDNIKLGVEGDRIYYSEETYEKLVQQVMDMSEIEAKDYIEKKFTNVLVYPVDYGVKQEVFEILKEEYPGDVFEEIGTIDISRWDGEADTLKTRSKMLLFIGIIATLIFLVGVFLLLKNSMHKVSALGLEALFCCVGMFIAFLANCVYINRENKLLQENEEKILRLLEYSLDSVYWIAVAGMIFGVIAVGLLGKSYKSRKIGEKKHA